MLLAEPASTSVTRRVSPDGRLVACSRATHDSYDAPGDVTLVIVALDGPGDPAGPRDLPAGFDRRPLEAVWALDGAAVYFTADDQGRRPVFRVDLVTGQIDRLTTDNGAYEQLCPAPDGRFLYALRAAVDEPPTPVRLDVTAPGTEPLRLTSPGRRSSCPGRLEESRDHGERRGPDPGLAGAAGRRVAQPRRRRCCSGCMAAR